MSDDRRTFLKKSGLLASALAVGAIHTKAETPIKNEIKLIKKVRPLGFQWETQDPFLFCVHHEDHFPEGNDNLGPNASLEGRNLGQDFILKDGWRMYHGQTVPGFPGHPHRGFETITVVRDGFIDHFDSLGGKARYGNGDVQWMTAGSGLLHSEMFPLLNKDKANRLELFQIWLNLPKRNKLVDPYFKMNWSEDVPVIKDKDSNGNSYKIEVLAGRYDNERASSATPESWAADDDNHVGIFTFSMDANAEFTVPEVPEGVNRSIYFFEGEKMYVNDSELPHYHAADLNHGGAFRVKNGSTKGQFLILQGKPINEPVVQHGPFVMNTKQEIQEAFMEYQQTQFGGWPLDHYDPTHGKDKVRFAKHPDGTEEKRG